MRPHAVLPILALLLAAPAAAGAQTFILPPDPDAARHGCTGFGYRGGFSAVTRTPTAMVITDIDSTAPAALAGLRSGDSVVTINGKPITDGGIGAHWSTPPGTSHTLVVRRAGATHEITFRSGQRGPVDPDPAKRTRCLPLKPEAR
jgi:C-terminal processing protease CtpA/Prc